MRTVTQIIDDAASADPGNLLVNREEFMEILKHLGIFGFQVSVAIHGHALQFDQMSCRIENGKYIRMDLSNRFVTEDDYRRALGDHLPDGDYELMVGHVDGMPEGFSACRLWGNREGYPVA